MNDMSEQAADDLRELVWHGLVDSDAQSRYYGYLAGRITYWNKILAGAGCVFAVASGVTVFMEWGLPVLAIVLVLVTGAISAISAVQGAQAQVAMAIYCQKRFDDLHIDWKALWHELPTLDSGEAVARWADLSRLGNDATALSPVNTVNKKLHRRSQDESKNYFLKTYHPQVTVTDDPQALPEA